MVKRSTIGVGLFSYRIGGSERIGAELAMEYARQGHGVVCFAFYDSKGPVRDRLEANGIRCVDANSEGASFPIGHARFVVNFWKMLRRERIDALHLHHVNSLILGGLAARALGIPTVVTEHSVHQFDEAPRYRWLGGRFCRLANHIVVLDEIQRDYFVSRMGVAIDRVSVVRNGVRVEPGSMGNEAKGGDDFNCERFVFLFLGRLHEVKNLELLLQAVSKWSPEMKSRCRLHLVGDGPEQANLEQTVDRLCLRDQVRFCGPTSNTVTALRDSHAFVMSSRTEGIPMALLEAMAAGLPCISTGVGAIPDILREGAGLIVEPGNADELSSAMEAVWSDPDLRSSMRRRGLQRIREEYDIRSTTDAYLKLLANQQDLLG